MTAEYRGPTMVGETSAPDRIVRGDSVSWRSNGARRFGHIVLRCTRDGMPAYRIREDSTGRTHLVWARFVTKECD